MEAGTLLYASLWILLALSAGLECLWRSCRQRRWLLSLWWLQWVVWNAMTLGVMGGMLLQVLGL
ncbi:MAG: hypothetical protein QXI19_06980 [Candidatus Caldarchaeum sp.]